ncbi:MAG: competence type IV pilus major pilin ComGC [Verrucomicrobiota bacterium]
MVVCLFIIGLLAAIAIPNFVKARTTSCKSACVANLKQIDGAIQQWALENKKVDSDPVDFEAAKAYLKGGVLPSCPSGGGSYAAGKTVADPPTCTFRYQNGEGHSLPSKK